ncbi:hypothetical protein [Noviherbaspirillum sp.]|uniref:hypothetical protein n=1 Tax=Noviherbaspirillum sp. TaxID=1926288 RepID=UPI002FE2B3EA
MSNLEATIKTPKDSLASAPTTDLPDTSSKQSFLLLKTGTASKLGKQSEGSISYDVLTDTHRQALHIVITGNDGGGYFSNETVLFSKIEACITSREREKPFPSKTFKEAFVGRSSNNAGFLAAILHAEGLLARSTDNQAKHVLAGDWNAWEKALLSASGKTIETDPVVPGKKQVESDSTPDHKEHKKTLTLPRKKAT